MNTKLTAEEEEAYNLVAEYMEIVKETQEQLETLIESDALAYENKQ